MVWIGAGKETRRLRERIELSVVMSDSISNESALTLTDQIKKKPFAGNVTFISKEAALKKWTEETGENLEALFGVNPLSPEINFTLKAAYTSPAEITRISRELAKEPGVETVAAPESQLVDTVNKSLSRLTILLGCIAGVMLIISFVLINNTVHLTIYSRRFTIHTMQLVGATNGYIRKPVILNNMFSGLIAGLLASGIIALCIAFSPRTGFTVTEYVGWEEYAAVAGAIILLGMCLCSLAAWIASAKYLRKDYDELFK